MGRSRAVVAVCGLASAAALAVPAASSACVNPDFGIGGGPVGTDPSGNPGGGPGEEIGFSISHTDPGAQYTIDFGGVKQQGEDVDGGGVSGTVTVPDLGEQARSVTITATIDHVHPGGEAETETSKSFTFGYSGYPVPPDSSGGDPAPQQPATPAPPVAAQPSVDAPTHSGGPSGSGGQGTGGDSGPALTGDSATSEGARSADRAEQSVGETGSVAGASGTTQTVATADANAGSSGRESGRADASGRALDEPAQVPRFELASPSSSAPLDADAPRQVGKAVDASSGVLLGTLLLALVTVATMLALAARGRGWPDEEAGVDAPTQPWMPPSLEATNMWRMAEIEAELQEMVAEERARRLLGDPGRKAPSAGAERKPLKTGVR